MWQRLAIQKAYRNVSITQAELVQLPRTYCLNCRTEYRRFATYCHRCGIDRNISLTSPPTHEQMKAIKNIRLLQPSSIDRPAPPDRISNGFELGPVEIVFILTIVAAFLALLYKTSGTQ